MKNWLSAFVLFFLGNIVFYACVTGDSRPTAAVTGAHPQFEKMCSKCHTLDRVHAAHNAMNAEQMKDLVRRMADKPGSGIHKSDVQHIVQEMY